MRVAIRLISVAILVILLAPMLVACGEDGATQSPTSTAGLVVPATSSPVAEFTLADPGSGATRTPETSMAGTPGALSSSPQQLMQHELLQYQPNEAGRVPVFMYHNIVGEDAPFDSSVGEYMYRTRTQFWNDMLFLYENNFYLTPMSDVVHGTIDIPAGKHPVVFTFDDSTSLHLTLVQNEQGEWVPDEDCAVGMMESFYRQYPDFGRGAYFATVPGNGFSWPAMEQDDLVTEKVEWLISNNYEIGNHTMLHPDLSAISADEFRENVGFPILWLDRQVGADNPMNAMRILTLPFGIYPEPEVAPENYELMIKGFYYEDVWYEVDGVLLLNGGSTWSYYSQAWDAYRITRVPVDDSVFPAMATGIETGESYYYTSDGNPNTVTVPKPATQPDWAQVDADRVTASGKTLVTYDPETGEILP